MTTSTSHGLQIESLTLGPVPVVRVTARGTLTHDDYVAFMPQLDAAFAEQTGDRLRLLFDARELQGWELRAALDDLKVVMTHGRQVERMALVTDARWMELLSNIGKMLLAGEMRHFHNRDEAEAWISGLQDWAASRGLPSEFGDLSSDLLTRVSRVASQFSQRLLGILGATLGTTINTVIVLVLAVFFLLGGDAITAGLARWLPEQWRALVISTITRTFRGYFGGQVLLALILSAGQILVFTLLSIPYGVLFAVLIGLTTLIPYASALTIVAVSALLAVQDPRTGLEILAAAIGVGQIVDQVIQPRLMGSIVGLQPAWLLIALPLGARAGDLLGLGELLGLLLAVPVASCFKTLVDAWVELRTSPESRPG